MTVAEGSDPLVVNFRTGTPMPVASAIADGSITLAKLANLPAHTVIGRNTNSLGVPEQVTFTQFMDWVSAAVANGDMIFRNNAGVWDRLPIGSATQVMTVSASVLPSWAAASAAIGVPAEYRAATATVTIPTGATKCLVILQGAGGGGGGALVGPCCLLNVGNPGAAGATLYKVLTGLTAGLTLALTIGAAGTAGAATPTAGGDGGNTILASGTQAITTLTANGGKGGIANATAATAASLGGTATNGDLNQSGIAGWMMGANFNKSVGGSSPFGAGGITVSNVSTTGIAATGWGAGGGGALGGAAGAKAGGVGSQGGAVLIWFS